MQKNRYLKELDYHLRALPKRKREDIINHYKEKFNEDEQLGIDPTDTIIKLGKAKRLADIELSNHTEQDNEMVINSAQQLNIPVLILVIIGNLVFVVPIAFVFAIVSIVFWAISISFMATPLLAIWQNAFFQAPAIFILLLFFGIGTIFFVMNYYVSKAIFWFVPQYFNWMNEWVKG